MADNITRCPKCATSFRISAAHLSSAKGSVRCGSCLSVFNAKKHLIPSPQEDQAQENNDAHTHEDDEVLISDTMQIGTTTSTKIDDFREEFNDGMFGGSDAAESEFNLFERETLQDEDEDEVPQDESWVLDLLNDDEPETEEQPEESEEPDQDSPYEEAPENKFSQNSFQIIEERNEPSSAQATKELFNQYNEVEVEEYDYSDNAQVYAQPIHSTGTDYLAAIEPEPVEFNWHGRRNFWQSRALWTCLSLLAGTVLIGQFAWIKLPSLSLIEPYRNYYSQACQLLSCTLPELIDRSKIRSANLIVRSHPKIPNALIVDAVIQNTAQFEQTFPVLDVVFTDNRDKVVAARRLTPDEYLGGELSGRKNMPKLQPVHIAIEIADPGQEATGYKIIIVN